jgi:hypothetical protein
MKKAAAATKAVMPTLSETTRWPTISCRKIAKESQPRDAKNPAIAAQRRRR